jgi:hypothetical protein
MLLVIVDIGFYDSGRQAFVTWFKRSLEKLREDILLMASLVRRSVGNAKTGLVRQDEDEANPLPDGAACRKRPRFNGKIQ